MSGSLRQKQRVLEGTIEAGLLVGPTPSIDTIRTLEARWNAGEQSIEDYYDSARTGRPKRFLPRRLENEVAQVIDAGRATSAHALHQKLVTLARETGVREPTYYQVHRRLAEAGRFLRSTSRHGSRAGEIDGLPHARVPSLHSHDTWALDELTMPVWVRMWYAPERRWVSARADVVLIVDVCSGAVVGHHLVDPTRRKDESGAPMLSGFDTDDVLAALLSAACPEFAHDSNREFAGYLPDRLRLDNHQVHIALEQLLGETLVEIDIRRTRVRRPASNGAVERRVQILKNACGGILGHIDDYMPADQVSSQDDLARLRTKVAGYTNDREARLTPIRPEDLLTVEELRDLFDKIVYRYNYESVNRRHRMTPADKYQVARAPRRPRRGRDLLRTLPPHTVKVGSSGIQYNENARTHEFFPLINGKLIMLDQAVTFYAHPHGEGIFVEDGPSLCYLRRKREWDDDEAAHIAKSASAAARQISDHAQDLRDAELDQAVGSGGAEAGQLAFDEARKELSKPERQSDPAVPSGSRPATKQPAPIFLNPDPKAFVRSTSTTDDE